jgi:SAM-dependent methyltransferase
VTREQRLVFGEDAELYDRARPGYSDALVASVLSYAGTSCGASTLSALEIGAGTGKATVAFAAQGMEILAVEPDPAMAAVAARNTAGFPGVRVERSAFEDWPLDNEGTFDLVFSAQAWHWVRPEVRGPKASAALRAGGTLALFWHRPHWPAGDPVQAALDACYAEHAPDLRARGPGFPGLGPGMERRERDEIAGSGLFTDVTVRHHPWAAETDADDYLSLLATQSDHRLLQEAARERLFAAVRDPMEELGGTMRVPYDTLLVLARPAR